MVKRSTASSSVKLTDLERQLLALLSARPRTTDQLIGMYWKQPPFNAGNILRGRLTGIARKLEHVGDPRRIVKSPRRGPHHISYWVEK